MKIAIAHASAQAARALQAALREGAEHSLLWNAENGADTLRKIRGSQPDLLLLDVSFSNPDSVAITRTIMEHHPCAILLISDRGMSRMSDIYEAMGAGALDVIACPSLGATGQLRDHQPFVAKMRTVGKILGPGSRLMPSPARAPQLSGTRLVAIGASTGGPQALLKILSGLPKGFEPAIVIVQHVDSEFAGGLASWLQTETGMSVRLATPGCRAVPGAVLLAGTNDHLVLTAQGSFTYTSEPEEVPYRPSVDALFGSLALHWPRPGVAVLLTGMGRDGAQGMKRLKDLGWQTLAQDEASSIVFGMPKAAIELGAVSHTVPLSGMCAAILRACGSASPGA